MNGTVMNRDGVIILCKLGRWVWRFMRIGDRCGIKMVLNIRCWFKVS